MQFVQTFSWSCKFIICWQFAADGMWLDLIDPEWYIFTYVSALCNLFVTPIKMTNIDFYEVLQLL